MLCGLGAVVFAAQAAGRWLATGAMAMGFVLAATVVRVEHQPDALWTGVVVLTSGLQLFHPRLRWLTAACGGVLAGLSVWFMLAHGLPKAPAVLLAAALPAVSLSLALRSPAFAPDALQEEALLAMLALGLSVAVVPEISAGWRSALALNVEQTPNQTHALPSWVMIVGGLSVMFGGIYSFWRHR